MFTQLLIVFTLVVIYVSGQERSGNIISTTVSDGVTSMGYKVVYGDEDLAIINEVVKEDEKKSTKKINLNEGMTPLPPQDVKCLMSVDRYCSKEMGELKSILIQAVKQDCAKCSEEEKERAGRVIASLMTHDPTAWKLFLTRSALQARKTEKRPQLKEVKLRAIGQPEEVIRPPDNMYALPGVQVRVRRSMAELVD